LLQQLQLNQGWAWLGLDLLLNFLLGQLLLSQQQLLLHVLLRLL